MATHPQSPNPTARQRVERFKSFLKAQVLTIRAESHSAAACGSFKSFLKAQVLTIRAESHSAAACGSFKSFLKARTPTPSANPTARQRVDRSSPF